MGVFRHEAVATDPERRMLYMTQDDDNGRFYRFTPARWEDLTDGTLEAAREHDDGTVEWVAADSGDATTYAGGEGIAYRDGRVLFTTKSDQRIRAYDVVTATMSVVVDGQIEGPDNIAFSAAGDLYVCEDVEQEQDLVLLAPDASVTSVLRLGPSHAESELAGVAFDPSGTRMYLSSQRVNGGGMTFEVTGPFRQLAATTTTRSATSTTVAGAASGASDDNGGGGGSALPIVGGVAGVAGVAVVGLGGLAWWRHQRGTRTV
jgi:secreted PhoX family phosphatase